MNDDNDDVLYDLANGCEALFDTQLAHLKAQKSTVADLVTEYQQDSRYGRLIWGFSPVRASLSIQDSETMPTSRISWLAS